MTNNNKKQLANLLYNNIPINNSENNNKNKIENRIENAVKDAYWNVLINCPEDNINYIKEKQKVIYAIYKYFLKDGKITIDRRLIINSILNDQSFINFGIPFKQLKAEQIFQILDSILYDNITCLELMEFFRKSCKNYPTNYCINCRKYSSIENCNQ